MTLFLIFWFRIIIKKSLKEFFAKKDINLFKSIDDPMRWQEQQRDEW